MFGLRSLIRQVGELNHKIIKKINLQLSFLFTYICVTKFITFKINNKKTMKKFIWIFTTMLMFFSISLFAQDDGGLKEKLIELGVSPTVAVIVSFLILTVIGQVIPEKWTAILLYIEKLFDVITLGLHKLNESTNNLSPKQKMRKESEEREVDAGNKKLRELGITVRKLTIAVLLLFMIGSVGKAQTFSGFLKPVELNPKVQKMVTRAVGEVSPTKDFVWLFRPAVMLTATSVNFHGGSAETKALSSIGTGLSLSKFVTVNEKPYSQLSVNALMLTAITIDDASSTTFGAAVTVGLFNGLFNFGGGYLEKGFVLLIGTQISF